MKALIVYFSKTGNTKKVANEIAKGMRKKHKVKVESLGNFEAGMLEEYDLFGFGSGIYMFKPARDLLREIKSLPKVRKKKAFAFGTSGSGKIASLDSLKELLKEKGFEVKGAFLCKGLDNWGPFKLFGGINKERPNEEDLGRARKFGEAL
jgi:flavodoxin